MTNNSNVFVNYALVVLIFNIKGKHQCPRKPVKTDF